MAYQVDKFNGTFLVSVDDGTIDTTTDLRFVGKNYAGYGEIQNENFLFLLENFANLTPPPKAIEGQIWYDSGSKKLKFYDGMRFKVTTGAETSQVAPTGLTIGEMWWDTSTSQLYVWEGSEYVLIGPEASPELGQTSIVYAEIYDDQTPVPQKHPVIESVVGGKIISIWSNSEFTIGASDSITGFTRIKKGTTIVGTPTDPALSSYGVSYPIERDGTPNNPAAYLNFGTASDSLKLGGEYPGAYILRNDVNFDQNVHFQTGYSVGHEDKDAAGMWMYPSGIDLVFENRESRIDPAATTRFRMRTSILDYEDVAFIDKDSLSPGENGSVVLDTGYDLGQDDLRWKIVYADSIEANNISGDINGDTFGTHHGNVVSINPLTNGMILVNASTNVIGFEDGTATLKGTLTGNVIGDLNGTALHALQLIDWSPSITIPSAVNKESVVIRNNNGEINATHFIGIVDNADKLKVAEIGATFYGSATITSTANSIVARDAQKDITAHYFKGTATSAQFADLAEKYLTDKEYDVGTVIVVGGTAEVTASKLGDRAIGVVSDAPAYMMNCDLEGGTYIALKGRTPVKVIGTVRKGQQLIADDNGYASVGLHNGFAIALESSDDANLKLIEAVIL